MAERRLGSPGGVKWCLCCILMSIPIVSSFPHSRSADTGVPQTTTRRELFGIPLGNIARGAHAMNEDQLETAWSERGEKLLQSEEKPLDQTFKTETAEIDHYNRSEAQLQSSPMAAVLRESSIDAQPHVQATLSNTKEIYPNARGIDNQATHTTRKARMTSSEPNQNPDSKNNETIVTESSNHTPTVPESTSTLGVDTGETSKVRENANISSVTDKKNKTQDSFATISMVVQLVHSGEQQEVSQNSSDETTPLSKDKVVKSVDHTVDSLQKHIDFTSKQPENNEGRNRNKALEKLPFFRPTAGSHFDTRSAMGSPLSALKHRSTSLPLIKRQTSTFSFSKTRKSLLTPKTSLSTFKSNSFITKTDMEKWIKGNNIGNENSSKMSPPVPSSRLKTLTFRPSKIEAESSQAVSIDDAEVTSPNMPQYPEALFKDQQGTANVDNDNQPSLKTTLVHDLSHTEQKATKRKSTVKVRRSTRDREEDDSTLPSSRKRSNEAAQLETLTPGPASHSSKPSLRTTKKRHVPHQGTRAYNDYGCPNVEDDHTHHSIEWSSSSKLIVSLSGDGDALNVTWEIKSGSSKSSQRSHRQVRDTDNEAAIHTHNAKHVDKADSPGAAKVNFKNDALDIKPATQLINGFVVSYRIPGDEEYDSSRLRAHERYFVLHQLHADEDYTICVHAMSGHHRVHEECANWSKSLRNRKAVMGGLAGALFFLPCVVVIIIIVRKDRLMRAKHGSGGGTWHLTNPSLVRAFASCEESQEALVQEDHANSDRYTHTSKSYLSEDKAANSTNKSDSGQCCHPHLQKPAQSNHIAHKHLCGAQNTELVKDGPGARSSATRDSTKDLVMADVAADRELPLLNDILEDSTYRNPAATNTNFVSHESGLTSMSVPAHEVYSSAQIGCDTETNI